MHLPGVGENFHDHLVVEQHWTTPVATVNTLGPVDALQAVGRYAVRGNGTLTVSPFDAQLITDDFQLAVSPMHYMLNDLTGAASLPRSAKFTVYAVHLHPRGRGRVLLEGSRPLVDYSRLGDAWDVDRLTAGAQLARRLVGSTDAMRGVVGAYASSAGTDDGTWLARHERSIFHAVGTCRMGTDDGAVVDPSTMAVCGISGLRVVDASVIPTIPSGNTNAATMMIAHRAADLILHQA